MSKTRNISAGSRASAGTGAPADGGTTRQLDSNNSTQRLVVGGRVWRRRNGKPVEWAKADAISNARLGQRQRFALCHDLTDTQVIMTHLISHLRGSDSPVTRHSKHQ